VADPGAVGVVVDVDASWCSLECVESGLMLANDLTLTLMSRLATANTVDQPESKGSGTVRTDRLAECPTTVLGQCPLDMLLYSAVQGLEHTAWVLHGDAHVLVTGDRVGDHVDQMGTVTAALASGFFDHHRSIIAQARFIVKWSVLYNTDQN
jgi:hypothetical protein